MTCDGNQVTGVYAARRSPGGHCRVNCPQVTKVTAVPPITKLTRAAATPPGPGPAAWPGPLLSRQ